MAQALSILHLILTLYFYYMVIVIIMSWIPEIHEKKWYLGMRKVSDLYLSKFRGWFSFNTIDFTPAIGLLIYDLALYFLKYLTTIL